jgi:predicted metal-binding protein
MMSKLFLTCKHATELIERKQETELSFKSGLQLKFHLMMCKACKAYYAQSLLINKALKKYLKKEDGQKDTLVRNEKLKERILSKI